MIKALLITIFLFPIICSSQNNIIYHEKKIKLLIEKYEQIQLYNSTIDGWRIQIAFADKKLDINKKKIMLLDRFPELDNIYLTYTSPYYRLRIGNFRNKLEAEKFKYEIKKYYPNA